MYELTGDGPRQHPALGSREVTALAAADGVAWAIADRRSIARRESDGTWTDVARSDEFDLVCLLPMPDGLLVGTDEAHLLRLDDHTLGRVAPFDAVEGRDAWYTPWGGPPAVRSIARDLGGRIHANVHVGGIRAPSTAARGGAHDRHRRRRPPSRRASERTRCRARRRRRRPRRQRERGSELADRAARPARNVREGRRRRGGHDPALGFERAPRGRAALYRTAYGPDLHLEKCTDGLPEWFDGNIDSGWLVARESVVAFGTGDGVIFLSDDEGEGWTRAAEDVPSIRALCFV